MPASNDAKSLAISSPKPQCRLLTQQSSFAFFTNQISFFQYPFAVGTDTGLHGCCELAFFTVHETRKRGVPSGPLQVPRTRR